jgi:cation diffusion facilitator family transporter
MPAFEKRVFSEEKALMLSILATLILCVLGVAAGLYLNSYAIFLDGLFSLFSTIMTAFNLFICMLLSREDDDQFQFGYSHFEPLVTILNALILFALCLYSIYKAVHFLLDGGYTIQLDFAIVYCFLTLMLSILVYRIEINSSKKINSELLRIDALEWLIDGMMSFALLAGFSITWVLEQQGNTLITQMIDPVLTILMAACACWLPIQIFKRNMREVLRMVPNDGTAQTVQKALEAIEAKEGVISCQSHLAKWGRRYELEINILVNKKQLWRVEDQDKIRDELLQKLNTEMQQLWLSVCFTEEKRWL